MAGLNIRILLFLAIMALLIGQASATVLWSGDYETGDISQYNVITCVNDTSKLNNSGYPLSTFPRAQVVKSGDARQGSYYLNLTVYPDDSCNTISTRERVGMGRNDLGNAYDEPDLYYSWSVRFPNASDFLNQWTVPSSFGLPGMINNQSINTYGFKQTLQGAAGGPFDIYLYEGTTNGGTQHRASSPVPHKTLNNSDMEHIPDDTWMDFIWHVKYSNTTNGIYQVWYRVGSNTSFLLLTNLSGHTNVRTNWNALGDTNVVNNTIGTAIELYREISGKPDTPQSIWIDSVKVGTTWNDVYFEPNPVITFTAPTPLNNSINNTGSITINITSSVNSNSITLDWNQLLKLWLRMEETTGINIVDSSMSGNNGTSKYNISSITGNGSFGNGFYFNNSQNITFPPINLTTNFTLSGIFNYTGNLGVSRVILAQNIDTASNIEYGVYLSGNSTPTNPSRLQAYINGDGKGTSTWGILNNTNYSWAYTYSNTSGGQFYINGIVNGSLNSYKSDINHDIDAKLIIGDRQNGSNRFLGTMDNIKIHNRVLSPEEIYSDYTGTNGLNTTITNLSDGSYNITAFVQDSTGAIANTETRYWTVDTSIPTEAQFTRTVFFGWE